MVSPSQKELVHLIKSDLFRYNGQSGIKAFFYNILINRGFKISVYYRIGHYLYRINSMLLKPFTLFYIFKCNKYTINISLKTSIGFGFYLGHPFAVAISRYAKLGNNVNISQGVTIGQKQSQSEILAPTIGNNVYVGPGSLLIGKITIADHVVIAGNSVVTKDIPECAVVAGEAAQIMSYKGSNSLLYYLWDQKEHQ